MRAGADGGDDLGVIDPLEIDGGNAEVRVSELALNHVERDPFACHLDGVGVSELVRCEAPSHAGLLCESVEVAADGGAIPATACVRPVDDAEQRTGRQPLAQLQPRAQVFPGPRVHADLAPAAAFCRSAP